MTDLRPVSYEEFLKNADRILKQYPELNSRDVYDHLMKAFLFYSNHQGDA